MPGFRLSSGTATRRICDRMVLAFFARKRLRSSRGPASRVVGLRVKTGPGHLDTTGFVLREPFPR
ncbi:hypothetical protein [Paludisphaera sp.]|uniref:hypothetical protein n=1 Tax=Paludisphaera sp. TaxID=2017432 RepID=UPI00301D2780